MSSELGAQATTAILVSFVMQWLKKSRFFPWLTVETETLNYWVSAIIAFLTGVGIFVTWSQGTLTISGLTSVNIYHALVRGVEQWAFQTTAYRALIAPPPAGYLQGMLDRRVATQDRRQATTDRRQGDAPVPTDGK